MKTNKILSISALVCIAVCGLMASLKMMMHNDKKRMQVNQMCGMLFFAAIVLLGVSQILHENENEKYKH